MSDRKLSVKNSLKTKLKKQNRMKPKKITSCMLFAMIFSCGMSLQAANIKAVNFIHDNSIRGCDIHLSQEGNKYFADVYNQQQTIEMWVRIS